MSAKVQVTTSSRGSKSKRGKGKKKSGTPSERSEISSLLRLAIPSTLYDYNEKLLITARTYRNAFDGQVFRIRQSAPVNTITQIAAQWAFRGDYYTLSGVAQANSWSTVFDQYRLDLVVVRFRPVYTEAPPLAGVIMPRLYTVLDYDDANVSSYTVGSLRDYSTLIETAPCSEQTRCIVPRLALAAWKGSGFSAYANSRQWIDMSDTGVQWYGVKYGLESGLLDQTVLQTYNVEAELYWAFRAVR